MSKLFGGLNEYLEYMHELAVEHYDPAWNDTGDYEHYDPAWDNTDDYESDINLEDIPF